VTLARGEFAITALLAEHAGIPVSYREIFHAMQTDLFATGVSGEGYRMFVRAAVERIRQKFRALDPAFAAIEHDAGIGYRWRL
jgi:two-component system response regulator ChvI